MLRAVVQRRLVSAARGPRVTRRALAEDAKTKAESKTEEERAGEGASNATGEGASSDSTSGGGLFDEIRRQVHKESQSNDSLKATLEELETTRCEKRRAAR